LNYFYLDASAWVKRYHSELGSDIVDLLFKKATSPQKIITSIWSLGETFAVLNRNKNRFNITKKDFNKITSAFLADSEILHLLPLSDNHLFKSIEHINKYNLNSADAYHLSNTIYLKETLAQLNYNIVFVSADLRLIKSAKGEGLFVFNPESDANSHLLDLLK